MRPTSCGRELDDLFLRRLLDMIDMRCEMAKLAAMIDWEFLEAE